MVYLKEICVCVFCIWLNAESTGNLTWRGDGRGPLGGGGLESWDARSGRPGRGEPGQDEPSRPRPSRAQLGRIAAKPSQAVPSQAQAQAIRSDHLICRTQTHTPFPVPPAV